MKPKVFIDGAEGTTGLQIHERLENRDDIELLRIDAELRKDENARREMINNADVVILCLPDEAAKASVLLAVNPNTRIIDASTAHRTNPDWVYGFPEYSVQQREQIETAMRVTNPGCHATGIIALIAPLVETEIMPGDYPLVVSSLTGYSGAGKSAIAQYEAPERDAELDAPRLYGLNMSHKHIPEIMRMTRLERKPAFSPVICDYYCGMEIIIPLFKDMLKTDKRGVYEILRERYKDAQYISVSDKAPESGYMASNAYKGTNHLEITVSGSEEIIQLTARYDNLGKGASGAAVQNMNIMLGYPEDR